MAKTKTLEELELDILVPVSQDTDWDLFCASIAANQTITTFSLHVCNMFTQTPQSSNAFGFGTLVGRPVEFATMGNPKLVEHLTDAGLSNFMEALAMIKPLKKLKFRMLLYSIYIEKLIVPVCKFLLKKPELEELVIKSVDIVRFGTSSAQIGCTYLKGFCASVITAITGW